MPRIAEIKTIKGEIWVKVEIDQNADPTEPITLWTDTEIKRHDRDLALDIVRELQSSIDAAFPNPYK